jgi:cardiolipin synthase A/B
VVLGQEFGTRMQAMFDADLAQSEAITAAQWRRRPLEDRVKEFAAVLLKRWL